MGIDSGSIGVIVTTIVMGYAWWQFTGKYVKNDIVDWFKEKTDPDGHNDD